MLTTIATSAPRALPCLQALPLPRGERYRGLRAKLDELAAQNRFKTVEGNWITHLPSA